MSKSNHNSKYLEIRCSEIIKLFNKNYKLKLKKSACISKLETNINIIYIKLPKIKKLKIELNDFPIVQNLLGFIFFNLKNNIKTEASFNKLTFEILWIILDIINQSYDKFKNKQNINKYFKIYTDVVNFIQFGNYTFIVPDLKSQFQFRVKGYNLAKLTTKKLVKTK